VATKFGIVFEEDQTGRQLQTGWGFQLTINGSRDYVRRSIDHSLKRLKVDLIDLLYAHYLDPGTPVEEMITAMAEAVDRGKVKAIGLSNVTPEEVKRAHAVHPIAAVQYEYSLLWREAGAELLPTVTSIGAQLVCWSPLGAGFLTATIEKLEDGDFRTNNPKLQGETPTRNLERLEGIKAIAASLYLTPAQLALAWLLAQGSNILPVPGSRRISRIDENLAAIDVCLPAAVLQELDRVAPVGAFPGVTLV